MADEEVAKIFYGYMVSPKEENKEKIKSTADDADIKAEVVDSYEDSTSMIIGREIERSEIPGFEKVTAEELIEQIRDIERNKYVRALEKRFNLENVKPTLIISGMKPE